MTFRKRDRRLQDQPQFVVLAHVETGVDVARDRVDDHELRLHVLDRLPE